VVDKGILQVDAHDIALLTELGVRVVRFEARLDIHQTWDAAALAPYNTFIDMLTAAHIKPIVLLGNDIVFRSSSAAWNSGARELTPPGSGTNPFIDQFVLAARAVVVGLPKVRTWEIWNEPNNFAGQSPATGRPGGTYIYPSLYAILLHGVFAAIKGIAQDHKVLFGAPFGHNIGGTRTEDTVGVTYLNQVFSRLTNVTPVVWPFDALAQHYYLDQDGMTDPAHLLFAVDRLESTIRTHDIPAAKRVVHITEVGWTCHRSSDEETQAKNLDQMMIVFSTRPIIKTICWFLLRDTVGNQPYGLRTGIHGAPPHDQARQAYHHFQRWPRAGTVYVVQPGDRLSTIAKHFGIADFMEIYNANRAVIGPDPNTILPGEHLIILLP
jgi:hypothetical protein